MRLPPAPVVSAALSGFVCGVLLTLLATGNIFHVSGASTPKPTAEPTKFLSDKDLKANIQREVSRALGPLPSDPKKSRLLDVQLYPVTPAEVGADGVTRYTGYRSVSLVFRLNNHPFGKSWRLRAAQADVYSILRAIYTSETAVYDVQLTGRFPLDSKHPLVLTSALRAYMAYETASLIPWRHWGRDDEGRVWRLLTSRWVDPRFA